jgi:hypothetical protein
MQGLRDVCEHNGIQLAGTDAGDGAESDASAGKGKRSKRGSKKCSKGKRAKKKRRLDSSDEDDIDADLVENAIAPQQMQLCYGQHTATCTLQDAADCLHMLAAAARVKEWRQGS